MVREIIIKEINKPKEKKIDHEIKWVCHSLGILKGRDLEDTSFKIVNELLHQFKDNSIISTEEIASSLDLESPRVNHHLRNLLDSGIIIREKRKVTLRGGSLTSAIEEMQKDMMRMFENVLEVSREIDRKFY